MFQEISTKIHDLEMELTTFYRKYFKQFLENQEFREHNKRNKMKPVQNMSHNKNSFSDLIVEDLEFNTNTVQDICNIKSRNCVSVQTEDLVLQPLLNSDNIRNMSKNYVNSDSNKKHLAGLNISLTVSTSDDEEYILSESEGSNVSSSKEISLFTKRNNEKMKVGRFNENTSLNFVNKPEWEQMENERDMRSKAFTGNVRYSYDFSSEEALGSTKYNKSSSCPLGISTKNYRKFLDKVDSETCVLDKSKNLLNGVQLNVELSNSNMSEYANYKNSETDEIGRTPFKLSTCMLTGDKEIDEEIISFYKHKMHFDL